MPKYSKGAKDSIQQLGIIRHLSVKHEKRDDEDDFEEEEEDETNRLSIDCFYWLY